MISKIKYEDVEIIDEAQIIEDKVKRKLTRLQHLRYPLSYSCHIITKIKDGKRFGTGCLLEENIVLTCMHNLIDRFQREIVDVRNIQIYLGRNGKADQSIKYKVESVKFNQEYFSQKNLNIKKKYDFALIHLQHKPDAKKFDPLYFLSPSVASLQSKGKQRLFQLYGYDQKLNEQQWYKKYKKTIPEISEYYLFGCQFDEDEMDQDFIYYKVTTYSGKSGASLITSGEQGLWKIKGIHLGVKHRKNVQTGETHLTNYALRINQRVIATLSKWLLDWEKTDKNLDIQKTNYFQHKKIASKPSISKEPEQIHGSQKILPKKEEKVESIKQPKEKMLKSQPKEKENSPTGNFIHSYFMRLFNRWNVIVNTDIEQTPQKKEKSFVKGNIITIQINESIFKNHSSFENKSKQDKIEQQCHHFSQLKEKQQIENDEELKKYVKKTYKTNNLKEVQKFQFESHIFNIKLIPLNFQHVQQLTLKKCGIIDIPEDLSNLKNATTIDCSSNLIVEIANIFIPPLKQLILDQNPFEKVPKQVSKSKNLSHLSLNYVKKLQSLHENILNINLQKLSVLGVSEQFLIEDAILNKLRQKDYFQCIQNEYC